MLSMTRGFPPRRPVEGLLMEACHSVAKESRQHLSTKHSQLPTPNLAKIGIAHLYLPGGSSNLQLHVLAAGFDPKVSPSLGECQGPPLNTMYSWTPQVHLPNTM